LSASGLNKNIKVKMHRTIILLVVFYRCETWSLTLSEERGLRVLENRVVKIIFGPKKDKVMVEWRRLHKGKHYDPHSSPIIIHVIKSRRMIWTEHVACMGDRRGAYRVLVGRSEGWRPLGKSRY
jgi:hypothetical protein